MTTTTISRMDLKEIEKSHRFVVIHPLDDRPEEKVDTAALGPMPMTPSVKISLLSLRAYLIVMCGLVVYHVIGLAGLFGAHSR
jgi:hypothetical protein